MAKTVPKEELPAVKVLIVTFNNGTLKRITIPEDWVITFGPVVPFEKGTGSGSERGLALRLYRDAGKSHLQAVFRDVKEFVEEGSISIRERVVRRQTKNMERQTGRGARSFVAEAREVVWKDPFSEEVDGDEDGDIDLLALPTSEEQF